MKLSISLHELPFCVALLKELGVEGLSITMPLKQAIIPYLDHLSEEAKQIGAVNTVVVKGGRWIGENTDGKGALDALEKLGKVRGQHIVIHGAGGSARSIAYEALKRGARVTVINRTPSRSDEIAKSFSCQGGGYELWEMLTYDILINCVPDLEALQSQWILPHCVAMDCVHTPQNTPFLIEAEKKGCFIVLGKEMFIHQAALQQELWCGVSCK